MPTDALIQLQAPTTQVATYHGTPLVLPTGTPRRGLKARVIYSAAATAANTEDVTFSLDVSRDGGVTFNTEFESDPLVLSTVAAAGVLFVPFDISPSSVANGTQVRLSANMSGTGTSPTITYLGDVSLARP